MSDLPITERGDPRDRITNQLPLPPQGGRRLRCTRCGDHVTVYELPVEFIDPSVYVCGQCLEPVAVQLELGQEREPETVRYYPAMSEIPF